MIELLIDKIILYEDRIEIFYIYGNNIDPDEPNLEVHRDFFLSSQDYSTGISSKMNIPALATGEQALRWLRLVCEPMRLTSPGLMSVRVNQRQKKEKAGLLSCFLSLVSHAIIISNYGNFSKAEYLRTLRLKSKLFDLRVANANPCDLRRRGR